MQDHLSGLAEEFFPLGGKTKTVGKIGDVEGEEIQFGSPPTALVDGAISGSNKKKMKTSEALAMPGIGNHPHLLF